MLADVLRALRLRGTAYFRATFRAPWGMRIATRQLANFHVVLEGRCSVATEAGPSTELGPGDIVVFPHGHEHALRDAPASVAPDAAELLGTRRVTASGEVEFGSEDGPGTELICGHFELDHGATHPLLRALPATLVLRESSSLDFGWVATATQLAVAESTAERPGSSAVVDRLAEALMIQVIRAHAESGASGPSFLAALSDRVVSVALELVHGQPSHAWSVDELARRAGASRSAFAARFKELVGMSPMQYVIDWRMHGARELLRDPQLSLAQVAERVGYSSEFAFAKAFKRTFGQAPGSYRRQA